MVRGVQGAPGPGFLGRLAGRYLDEIHLNAARDRQTLRRFTEVSQLVRPPIALLDPVVAWRVARGAASRVARSARARITAPAARTRREYARYDRADMKTVRSFEPEEPPEP